MRATRRAVALCAAGLLPAGGCTTDAARTRVAERRAESAAATLDLFRTQDRIAAEVVQAYAQVRAAAERLNEAEPALREAVAAVQALAQANADFFAAVSDYSRAQFRLYRALGHPAQCLAGAVAAPAGTGVASTPVALPSP